MKRRKKRKIWRSDGCPGRYAPIGSIPSPLLEAPARWPLNAKGNPANAHTHTHKHRFSPFTRYVTHQFSTGRVATSNAFSCQHGY